VLTEHGVPFAPSTYYDALNRPASRRVRRDEALKTVIAVEWDRRKILGARTLWLRLRRQGHDVARCTVERLMGELGLVGATRGGAKQRPADTGQKERRAPDLVDRHFGRFHPDQLWVADFTYVWTWAGWVYVAFVFDAASRRILGWRAAASMATPLVLDCLEQALWTRRREGIESFRGLTHHTDAGSVYTSIAFTDRLIGEGIDASVGSVGDAYDNALAESQIGLFKTELIHQRGPWRDVDHVEAATADWVHYFNTERTHASIWDLTPIEIEQISYAPQQALEPVG
jgi:putative transposase